METIKDKPKNNWTEEYADKDQLQNVLAAHFVSRVELWLMGPNDNLGYAYSMHGINIWVPGEIASQLTNYANEKLKIIGALAENFINYNGDIKNNHTAFLNSSITDHGFKKRTVRLLKAHGCEKMGHLTVLRKEGVVKIKGFGKIAVEEIRAAFFRDKCIQLFDNDTSPLKKYGRQPKYSLGVVFRSPSETIIVKAVYPPGHQCASKKDFGYLINSRECGEDTLSERGLTEYIRLAR